MWCGVTSTTMGVVRCVHAAVRSGNGSGDGLPALTRGRRRLLGPRLGWLDRSAARLREGKEVGCFVNWAKCLK
jgi:hypothetical protein